MVKERILMETSEEEKNKEVKEDVKKLQDKIASENEASVELEKEFRIETKNLVREKREIRKEMGKGEGGLSRCTGEGRGEQAHPALR